MLVFRLATRPLMAPWVVPEAAALTIATMQTPEAPTGLAARGSEDFDGDGFVELIWNDPADDSIAGYQFRVQSLPDLDWRAWKDLVNEQAGTIHYTLWGLTKGCPYRIQLRALSVAGAGPPSEDLFIAPGTLSPVPAEDFNPERQMTAWHDWPGCWTGPPDPEG